MPSGPTDAKLAEAAALRAAGCSWESVAASVGRAADTVRKWPKTQPERWAAALADAERTVVVEASSEAVLILRQLLRSDDDKVRRDAARALLDLRFKLLAPPATSDAVTSPRSADARRLVAFLEAHTDEEITQLAAEMHAPEAAPVALGEGVELHLRPE